MTKCILILALSLFAFCAIAGEGYILKGTIHGDYSGYIYLSYGKIKDSALVQNNSFEFAGSIEKPTHAWLNLKPAANIVWIYLENSKISIEGDFRTTVQREQLINLYRITSIKGSHSQTLIDQYRTFCNSNREQENFYTLRFNELKRMFSANPSSPVMGWILGDLATNSPVYSFSEFNELYALLDTTAMQANDLRMIKTGFRTMVRYAVGERFSTFQLANQRDETVNSESFNGKLVLIDFWASWCAPCRAKHPDLVKLQKKYQGKNFAFVSISVDKDKSAWLKAIIKDGLIWENLLDKNSALLNELGIQAIPFNYLLDESGRILAVNPSLEEIDILFQEKIK